MALKIELRQRTIATVRVSTEPLPGEDWRASESFSLSELPSWTLFLVFLVTRGNNERLRFQMKFEQTRARDTLIFDDLRHKKAKPLSFGTIFPCYFGGARNATSDFTVKVVAVGGTVEEVETDG